MSYLDELGLARYDGLLKDWAVREACTDQFLNWRKTGTAGAVSFSPVPEMPIDPVVNFMFSETGPASGTKGPDNPSFITGVVQAKVTRCGKNLLKYPYSSGSRTKSGMTFTMSSDGSVLINGTATSDIYYYIAYASYSPMLVQGKRYAISGCPAGGSLNTYYFRYYGYTSTGEYDIGNGGTFIANASGRTGDIALVIKSGTTATNLVFKPQLEEASAATSFELYDGADYDIYLHGTYYGGSIDVSTGLMTVTWVGGVPPIKYVNSVSDGLVTFVWNYNGEHKFYGGSFTPTKISSTHFINTITTGAERIALSGNNDGTSWGGVLVISDARIGGAGLANSQYLANAQQWLVENNVVFAAQIWTPTTIQLTPTQIYSLSQSDPYTPRLNTVYSDPVSVQVGYPKSPQATQNELTNAIVSLGGNV